MTVRRNKESLDKDPPGYVPRTYKLEDRPASTNRLQSAGLCACNHEPQSTDNPWIEIRKVDGKWRVFVVDQCLFEGDAMGSRVYWQNLHFVANKARQAERDKMLKALTVEIKSCPPSEFAITRAALLRLKLLLKGTP